MMFRNEPDRVLAVSQPMHAWISGQLMRAWREPLSEPVLLAIEQHDLAWIDWEVEPSFDPATGRPHRFPDVHAATHAPMWEHGVARANTAWGLHVALLISRHGAGVYRRFAVGRVTGEDEAAVNHYMEKHARREAESSILLGLEAADLDRQSALLAFADALSLALCGALPAPMTIEAPFEDETTAFRLAAGPGTFHFTLDPWPFNQDRLVVEGAARALPEGGRFADEGEFRRWLKSAPPTAFASTLSRA
jgi:hypothetical protein